MATGRVFTANVVLARVRGGEATEFAIGDEVPQWAIDLVGDHASQGVTRASDAPEPIVALNDAGDDNEDAADVEVTEEEEDSYTDWTKEALLDEAKARELEVNTKMTKAELVAALEADDEE